MFLRSVTFACVAAMMSMAAPAIAETSNSAPAARCEDTAFRVYFNHSSAALNPFALQTLNMAARNLEGCSYAELHVTVDPASRYAAQRGQAILAALNTRAWNVARIEPLTASRVAYGDGPEFAYVMMTSHPVAATGTQMQPNAQPGV